jgi:hypothetical protein
MTGLNELESLAGKDVAPKLIPEIIRVLRVFDTLEDEEIQVPIMLKFLTNRRMPAPFSSIFPPEHAKKGEQLFQQEQSHS